MKNQIKIIFFLAFSSYTNTINAQGKCIDYKVLLNDKADYRNYSGLVNDLENKFKQTSFNLLIEDGFSLFSLKSNLNLSTKDREVFLMLADMVGEKCYNNKDFNFSLFEKSEKLKKNYSKTNWLITEEVKYIENYKCYKATCVLEKFDENEYYETYPVVAWFTYDINLPFGPNGFGKLPGLIFELEQAILTFKAYKVEDCGIEIDKSSKNILILPENYGNKENK